MQTVGAVQKHKQPKAGWHIIIIFPSDFDMKICLLPFSLHYGNTSGFPPKHPKIDKKICWKGHKTIDVHIILQTLEIYMRGSYDYMCYMSFENLLFA